MHKKILLVASLWLCAATALSQDTTNLQFTNDIGFNTQFLFDGIFDSNSTPFSIIYKTYSAPDRATRFGLDISMNLSENSGQGLNYFGENDSYFFSLSIGREFHRRAGKRWIFYYGADVAPFYQKSSTSVFQDQNLYYTQSHEEFGAALRPLLGIRYNISPRIYVAAEANLNLRYAQFHDTQRFSVNFPGPERDTKGKSYSIFVTPASGILFFYRF